MVEPLLHFALPFAALRAAGLDLRKTTFASLLALTPDLDVIFHVHRSLAHSAIVLAAVTIPLLVITRRNPTLRTIVTLGALGILTHLTVDLFQYYTPLLWPLSNQSLWISGDLALHTQDSAFLSCSMTILKEPTSFDPFISLDQPILTAEGVGISVILLTPPLAKIFLDNRQNRQLGMKRVSK